MLAAGCGYVGDPLPPAMNVVQPVADLRAVEIGDKLIVDFTLPAKTTEDLDWRKIEGVEMRIGPLPQPFDAGAWANGAQPIDITADGPGAVKMTLPASGWKREWMGREIAIGVRARNLKKRVSPWSNFATLRLVDPLAPPSNVEATSDPRGVRLAWTSPAPRFRILRKGPKDAEPVLLAEADAPPYVDASAAFGQAYEYSVFAVEGGARSESSATQKFTPEDKFPPTVPKGLRVIAGIGSLELAWDPNADADLKGYKLYRSVDGGAFEAAAGLLELPSFSDRKIEPGKRYAYAVAAVDLTGNESDRGQPVEIVSPR